MAGVDGGVPGDAPTLFMDGGAPGDEYTEGFDAGTADWDLYGGGPSTLPAGVTTVVVHGRLLNADGTPAVGAVEWTASKAVIYAEIGVTVLPTTVAFSLDLLGYFVAVLPATDDPAGNPLDWTYYVNEKTQDGRKRVLRLPISPNGVDYADLEEVLTSTGVPTEPVVTYFQIMIIDGGTP